MPSSKSNLRWLRAVLIGAALVAVTAGGIVIWWRTSQGRLDSYFAAPWKLTTRGIGLSRPRSRANPRRSQGRSGGLRVLARASARLGRDEAAMAIYERRLDEKHLEAEDHLLLGLLHQRQGQADAAARDWKKVLEAGEVSPQSLEELGRVYIQARHWDDAIAGDRAAERATGLGGTQAMMLGTIRVELNNVPGAAESFRRALELDPAEIDKVSSIRSSSAS